MNTNMRLLLLLAFVVRHVRASGVEDDIRNYEVTAAVKYITESVEIFPNRFLQTVNDVAYRQYPNIICSPISTLMILAMLSYGAIGKTKSELRTALLLPRDKLTTIGFKHLMQQFSEFQEVEFHLANKIFLGSNTTISKKFVNANQIFYSVPQSLNFNNETEANEIINDWSLNNTNNRIKNVVTPNDFDNSTLIMLSSVTYFKGSWGVKFDRKLTKNLPFYINGTIVKPIPTMYRFGSYRYGELPELNAQYIEIPYKNRDISDAMSMNIILPNNRTGISTLRKNFKTLTPKAFSEGVNRDVHLYLPKFTIGCKLDLNYPVIEMGIKKTFHTTANFFNIAKEYDELRLSKIIQKAVIEVDEEGDKEPPITNEDLGIIRVDDDPLPPISFTVDHPFISLIRTANGLTLFGSIIMDPSIKTKQNDSNSKISPQQPFNMSTRNSTTSSSTNFTCVTNSTVSSLIEPTA